jgi:rhamnogalacturonan endolyase
MRKPILYLLFIFSFTSIYGQRVMENLDRGVVAVRHKPDSVFISWRLLGTEPENLLFNIYRTSGSGNPVKINSKPISTGTNFIDTKADLTQITSYTVKAIINGKDIFPSRFRHQRATGLTMLLPVIWMATASTNWCCIRLVKVSITHLMA